MTDDGTKITIRMGPEVIQMMEDFMADNDIGNRSDFIRDAVRWYIDSQKSGSTVVTEGGIFVRLSDVHMDTLSSLVQTGIAVSEEEFVRKCLLDRIVSKDAETDAINNALKAAQMRAALK